MRVTFLAAIALSLATGVLADAPRTMSYQGVLTDAAGDAVADGDYEITLRLYDVATGGAELWSETHNPVATSGGVFALVLGNTTALDLPFDAQYWLEVQLGSDPAMSPRTALTAAPYSLNSVPGPEGPPGPAGPQGQQGVQGPAGPSGFLGVYSKESAAIDLQPNEAINTFLDCDPGDAAVGGGYSLGNSGLQVMANWPADEDTWLVRIYNPFGNAVLGSLVRVQCGDLTP